MSQVLVFALLGIGTGALIGGIGMGVVLSYRGGGVISLAAGSLAMLAGWCFWALNTGEFGIKFSTLVSVIFTGMLSLLLGYLFEMFVIRPFRDATPLAKLVATLSILLASSSAIVLAFGEEARPEPSILPSSSFKLYGAPINVNRLYIGGILGLIAIALIVYNRWTRFGIATRASAESQANAMLIGLSPSRISLVNTMMMAFIMGVVGVLAGSVSEIDSSTLALLIVPGLAAALFGRLSSIGVTYVAGVLIGVAESILLYFSTQSWFPTNGGVGVPLPGVQELLVFIVLAVAMFLRSGKIPGRGDIIVQGLPPALKPRALNRNAIKYGALVAVAMYVLPFGFRAAMITSVIFAIFVLSIVLITGFLGQVSLVQLALGGIAGYCTSHFAVNFGIGFPWAPILAVMVAAVTGFVTGIPALRVRGVGLVIITLAAAVAIQSFWFNNTTWGGGELGSSVPPPSLFGFKFGPNAGLGGIGGQLPSPVFGWFCLLMLLLVVMFVGRVREGKLGQEMLAVRSNERAASAVGINVRNTKLIGFTISAAIAGVGGVLLAYFYGSITPDSYSTLIDVSLIVFAYLAGITTIAGGVWAGMIFTGGFFAYALQSWDGISGNWVAFVGGIGLLAALKQTPEGIAPKLFYSEKTPFRETKLGRLLPAFGSQSIEADGEVDGLDAVTASTAAESASTTGVSA